MTTIIIEDEKPAARMLQRKLEKLSISVQVMLHSVQEAVEWFQKNQHPDLIFLDIQLSDGLSFEIFEKGGRTELAQKEKEEMDIIYSFLPAQLDDASLIQIIKEIIVETGATSMKDMGKVVSAANAKLAGKADGKRISTIVKDLISQ